MFWKSKELSPRRRMARRIVWGLFALMLVVRYGVLREYYAEYHREQQRERMQLAFDRERQGGQRPRGGGGPGGGWGRGGQRQPLPVRQARSEVPKFFPRLEIQIGKEDVEILRAYQWDGWSGEKVQRPTARVTVVEGGVTYTNVFLHMKGSVGSFRPFDDKPALTLEFAKGAKGRSFHGLTKLSLNNSAQDESYLSEFIAREIFLAAGVPATKVSHATVIINGRDLGLYVMAEGFGKPFLKRFYDNVGGNLYDSGFCRDIDADLDTNCGDHQENRSDLRTLAKAAMVRDPAERREALAKILDIDRFITYLALESLTCHWDGYSMNRNNYRLYHDLDTDKMVFLPHGMDQMFGVRRATPSSDILPPVRGMLAYAVLSLPGMETAFVDRIAMLQHKVFDPEDLVRRVREMAVPVHKTLEAYGPDFAATQQRATDALVSRIQERSESVSQQLDFLMRAGTNALPAVERSSGGPPGMRGPRR